MGVGAGHMTTWSLEQPQAGQRKGTGTQDDPDTLSKNFTFFNTHPPQEPTVYSQLGKGHLPLLIPGNRNSPHR